MTINETDNPNSGATLLTNKLLSLLPNDAVNILNSNSNLVRFNKGNVIIKQGTRTAHLMYLKKGTAKILKEGRNGKVLILKLIPKDNFLGLLADFSSTQYNFSVSAVEDSEVICIDKQTIRNLLETNCKFATFVAEELSREGLYIFERLMSQYQKQLPGRVADVILYFAEEIFQSNVYTFPLSRRELAELAGTTKESFIRTLSEFKHDRIIDLTGKKVTIISEKILKTLSKLG